MNLKSKLPNIGTNIFSEMSALANQFNAVNLSQGFPDYSMNKELCNLVNYFMQNDKNQYPPMAGVPELRKAISKKIEKLYEKTINFDDEITITPGGTYAIYTAFKTILDIGDEVIVLEPAYDSYIPNIESCGAKAILIPLNLPDFSVPWQQVKNAITSNTKAIIINTPHNPSGYCFTNKDWSQLSKIVKNTNIFIISDEVYEHIVFDGLAHQSILKHPDLWERTYAIYSFGKVFHNTGWKLGYCIAPKKLSVEYKKIHQFLCFSCNTPMQYALATFLENEEEYLQLPNFFETKRDMFLQEMQKTKFTLHTATQGTYFQIMSYEKLSNLPDKEFAIWLTKEFGVATIPLSAFYKNKKDDQLIRFCFAKQDATILKAIENLKKI